MKKLTIVFLTLIFWSVESFADFNFHLYNFTNLQLTLVKTNNKTGELNLPLNLAPYTYDTPGASIAVNDRSMGDFAYGIDNYNYCMIHYNQSLNDKANYEVYVTLRRGYIGCDVKQNSADPSSVQVMYYYPI